MFKAIVSKNMIEVTQTEPITSGSVNAYLVEFEFSDEWVDLERIAVFQTSGDPVNVLLDDTNICFIPWEVMTEFGGRIRFGVYGTAGLKSFFRLHGLKLMWSSKVSLPATLEKIRLQVS